MDLQPYADKLLIDVPSLAQVPLAPRPSPARWVDTEKLIKTIIAPAVAGRAYLLSLPAEPVYPAAVYQLVSSQPQIESGYQVAAVDTFLVYLRARNPEDLVNAGGAVIAALAADSGGWEITDQLTDYDEQQGLYRYNFEITLTYLPLALQTLPAALLFPVGERAADDEEVDGCTRQVITRRFGVVLATGKTDDPVMLLESITAALVGHQINAATWPALYQESAPLDSPGGLQLLAAVFRDVVLVN